MKRSYSNGHPIVWEGGEETGRWVYEDTKEPLPAIGGRPCIKCDKKTPLGEVEVDPCLGILPGVVNACCGHGIREESYVRFSNGVAVKGFTVHYTEKWEGS